jgi:hypothetical protein
MEQRSILGWNLAITSFILAVAFYRTSLTVADPDLWGHVRFGLDILQSGQIVQVDSYSYLTEGRAWINHEWLAEVLFALAYRWAGGTGLIVLKTTLSMVILGLIYRELYHQGLDALRGGLVLLLITLLFLPGVNTVRPQLFTYVCFLLLFLLIRAAEHDRLRWLWLTPPLFALWTNLHGGVLAGLAILFVWSGLHLTCRAIHERRLGAIVSGSGLVICATVAACAMATVINPYGVELPLFLLRTATVPRPEIVEWMPLRIGTFEGELYLLLLGLAVFGLIGSRRPRKPALIGVLLGAAVAPLMAVRHVPLFATAGAVVAAEHIADALRRWLPGERVIASLAGARPWVLLAPGVLAGLLVVRALPHFACLQLDPGTGLRFPTRAVALLRQNRVEGNLAVHFDWGEYVIWHLGNQVKVSVDGRRETLYSDEVYNEDVQFRHGLGDWDAVLGRPQTHLALVSKEFPVYNLLKRKADWSLLYEDQVCALFARQGWFMPAERWRPDPDTAVVPEDGAGLCFP